MSKSPVWDQVGHAAQGASVVLPFFVIRNRLIASALSGGIALFWRELSQLRRSNGFKAWVMYHNDQLSYENTEGGFTYLWKTWHLSDRILDVAFGAVGGAILGFIWWFLQ